MIRKHPYIVLLASILFLFSCKKDDLDPPANKVPVANAGLSVTIKLPTDSVTLTGIGSDADGQVVSYLWSQVSGPANSIIVNPGAAATEIKKLIAGTYVFQLMVTDDKGATGADTASVVVNPADNIPPIANAGVSINITLPTNVTTLTGTGTDVDGQIVSYLWSQVSGPSSTTIVTASSATTDVKNFLQGVYIFQLMVTDNKGATGVDTMTITVNAAVPLTLTLQPTNNPTEYQVENLNGQDQTHTGSEISIDTWTTSGNPWTLRNILKFDLSTIPANATIISANLYLYSNPKPSTGNLVDANSGPNNSLFLQQVTSNWSPSTLGWFNQPSVSTSNQINISTTTQSTLDLDLDVSQMIGAMVNNNANYGFLLRLQNEVTYNSRIFVSSYNTAYPQKHPKLVIVYK